MSCEPEIILPDHYGSYQPAAFCENYIIALTAQGLEREACIIMYADHAVSVLYDNLDSPELDGVNVARLTERASCAWMDILEKFVPEDGYHLGYIGASQALWMIPNGWHDPDFD